MLGIIGALDPHTHKTNQADLQGEGKLEREGVRPQRQHHSAGGPQDDTMGALLLSGCHLKMDNMQPKSNYMFMLVASEKHNDCSSRMRGPAQNGLTLSCLHIRIAWQCQ